ncbi:hypothetical protein [Maricaulis maris]|uniref:hypothetical protein n=1 Tax=Maricaulis maris TaxID=74318 RepID=UPI003A8EF2DB
MPFELFREPLIPASDVGYTTDELRRYLGVGRNNVTPVLSRFGILKLHGVVPETVLWHQLFGLAPADDAALQALREPLANTTWVSQVTRVPMSTLRDHLRTGRWAYDPGVQLGDTTGGGPPRLRRWIPALIRSRRLGVQPPNFTHVPPRAQLPDDGSSPLATGRDGEAMPAFEDAFSALFGAGSGFPR